MLGVKRMPRPLSESRNPESRRKTSVLRGMRLRQIDSPLGFSGQPCAPREREDQARRAWWVRGIPGRDSTHRRVEGAAVEQQVLADDEAGVGAAQKGAGVAEFR